MRLASNWDHVLATNQAGGALLFRQADGRLKFSLKLETNGEGSLSGALNSNGAYALTGRLLRLFPHGQTWASSTEQLLLGSDAHQSLRSY